VSESQRAYKVKAIGFLKEAWEAFCN